MTRVFAPNDGAWAESAAPLGGGQTIVPRLGALAGGEGPLADVATELHVSSAQVGPIDRLTAVADQ